MQCLNPVGLWANQKSMVESPQCPTTPCTHYHAHTLCHTTFVSSALQGDLCANNHRLRHRCIYLLVCS